MSGDFLRKRLFWIIAFSRLVTGTEVKVTREEIYDWHECAGTWLPCFDAGKEFGHPKVPILNVVFSSEFGSLIF